MASQVKQFFPDYQAALAASGAGYNDAAIAEVIAYKTALPLDRNGPLPEQAVNSILAVSFAAAAVAERPLRVLDFGGGCGFHYLQVTAAMPLPLRWAIVETPTMAVRAKAIAQGRFEVFSRTDEAIACLGGVDLVHASASLQYTPDPFFALAELVRPQPPFIALLRLPLWIGERTVGLEEAPLAGHGIGPLPPGVADRPIACPVTLINFGALQRALSHYEIAFGAESASARFRVAGTNVPGVSVFFRRKP